MQHQAFGIYMPQILIDLAFKSTTQTWLTMNLMYGTDSRKFTEAAGQAPLIMFDY